MAYLGNTPTTQSFIAGTDVFNGTGAQVAYTLTRSVNSPNDIEVVVNNVEQDPSSYSAAGTLMTFSSAPSSGTGNIYVRYLSTTLQSIAPSQGSVSPDKLTTGGLYWDVDGNVGIGNITPNFELDVSGSIAINTATANHLTFHNGSGSTYAGIRANTNSNLIFTIGSDLVNGEQARIDSAGLFKFNSGYGSVATAYGCRAWVNFNGTGTVAIRASGNVSSITDNGAGTYAANLITAMPDTNYSVVASANSWGVQANPSTVSAATVIAFVTSTGTATDRDIIQVAIFR